MEHGRRRRIALVVILLLLGGGAWGWWRFGRSAPDDGTITLLGTTDIREAHLAFRVPERVSEVLVDEGDGVVKGQLLATLDTTVLQSELDSARANAEQAAQTLTRLEHGSRPEEIDRGKAELAAAQAQVQDTQSKLRDTTKMHEQGGANTLELESVQARYDEAVATADAMKASLALLIAGPRVEDIDAARAAKRAAEARVGIAAEHLADARLVAPADGIIRARLHEAGEMVSPASPVVLLAISDPVWVRVYLDEVDLGRVSLGMRARVRIDSNPEQSYEGWLGSISPTAEFTPKPVETERLRTSLVYQARVFVKDPGHVFKLGMPATVTLVVGDKIIGSQGGGDGGSE